MMEGDDSGAEVRRPGSVVDSLDVSAVGIHPPKTSADPEGNWLTMASSAAEEGSLER